jgi:hypothetical protein
LDGSSATGFSEKALSLWKSEVAVEMGGAHAVEDARREGKSQRIGLDHARRSEALACDGEHPCILVGGYYGSCKVASEKPCATSRI